MPLKRPNDALPWVEKYRPKTLNGVVHHTHIIHLLRHFISTHEMPHLFFYGPPGTGKTSTILSCAKEVYGKATNMMVLHLNASDERGIDVVRKQIIQFASTSSLFHVDTTMTKLVVLDEADSMTHAAQIALRDIMMQYDTLFCLIGNYQYALLPPLQSRVIRLLFTPIPVADAVAVGTLILAAEGVTHEPGCLERVYEQTGGDMRQFVNVLQALEMRVSDRTLTDATLRKLLCRWDQAEVQTFVRESLAAQSPKACYDQLYESIVTSHTHTLTLWLDALLRVLLELSKDATESLIDILDLCTDMANAEYHASVSLQPDVQLFAIVACTHRFARRWVKVT
jgi:DNA polymerase III delta prime subunit